MTLPSRPPQQQAVAFAACATTPASASHAETAGQQLETSSHNASCDWPPPGLVPISAVSSSTAEVMQQQGMVVKNTFIEAPSWPDDEGLDYASRFRSEPARRVQPMMGSPIRAANATTTIQVSRPQADTLWAGDGDGDGEENGESDAPQPLPVSARFGSAGPAPSSGSAKSEGTTAAGRLSQLQSTDSRSSQQSEHQTVPPQANVMASLLDILRSPNSLAATIPKSNLQQLSTSRPEQPKPASKQQPQQVPQPAAPGPGPAAAAAAAPRPEAATIGVPPPEGAPAQPSSSSDGGACGGDVVKNTFIEAAGAEAYRVSDTSMRFSSEPPKQISEDSGGSAACADQQLQAESAVVGAALGGQTGDVLAESLVRAAMQILRESAMDRGSINPGQQNDIDERSIAAATDLLQRCAAEQQKQRQQDAQHQPQRPSQLQSDSETSAALDTLQNGNTVFQASRKDEPAYVSRMQPLPADRFQ